jgi:hypothetical protein
VFPLYCKSGIDQVEQHDLFSSWNLEPSRLHYAEDRAYSHFHHHSCFHIVDASPFDVLEPLRDMRLIFLGFDETLVACLPFALPFVQSPLVKERSPSHQTCRA